MDITHNYVIVQIKTGSVNIVKTNTSKMEAKFLTEVLSPSFFELELRRMEFLRNAQPLSN